MVQRDARVIAAVRRLSELAEEGRRCIAGGSVEGLGPMMGENWRLQQELDPSCSTPEVDALFRAAEPWACGAKLVGAGGGGFAVLLGKSKEDAREIKALVGRIGGSMAVYEWTLWEG